MSWVTGITLHYRDNYESNNLGLINNWLKEREFPSLKSVERYYGGNKHPQIRLAGAGINYFTPLQEFVKFIFHELYWDHDEDLILIARVEDSDSIIYTFKSERKQP